MAKKILIIEDEQTLVRALMEGIDGDYELLEANDGEEGLRRIKEEKPDFVVLDLVLPKMDGFQVLQKISEDLEIKDTPVMVLTNLSDVEDKVKALGAGKCLVKSNSTIDEIREHIIKSIN